MSSDSIHHTAAVRVVTENAASTMPHDAPIELSMRDRRTQTVFQVMEQGQSELTPEIASSDPKPLPRLKLLSAGLSFFVAGTNDGSMGPLLPHILQDYHIGTSLVAIL
jgi:fucose permease